MESYYIKDKTGDDQLVDFGSTRVILINKKYDSTPSDPVWGNRYACVGTVERLSSNSHYPIIVLWDNDATGGYRTSDLQIHTKQDTKSNPNLAFKRAKKTGTTKSETITSEDRLTLRKQTSEQFNKAYFGDAPLAPNKEEYVVTEPAANDKALSEELSKAKEILIDAYPDYDEELDKAFVEDEDQVH